MSIFSNTVSIGGVTRKSQYDSLYNGSVLANTGGTPGGAQSIPGVKTFEDGIIASASSSIYALSNKINLRGGFVASGTCTYYAPVSGEESAGTYVPFPTSSSASYLKTWTITATGQRNTFDWSSIIPVGAKAVHVSIIQDGTSAAAANPAAVAVTSFSDSNTYTGDYNAGNALLSSAEGYRAASGFIGGQVSGPVKIDADRKFYGYQGLYAGITQSTVYVHIMGYYI